jgi:subtilase family serine protease
LRVGVASIRTALARLSAATLTLPILLGGGAAPAVVTHAMTPATGNSGQYQDLGEAPDLTAALPCGRAPVIFPLCYTPAHLRAAYDIQPLLDSGVDGTGATIVIVDAFSDPFIAQDLNTFDTAFGLPATSPDIVTPDGPPPFNMGWAVEISLDVEWAHAVAPGAHIVLVLAKSNEDADLLSATRYAIDHDLGDVVSQSFAEAESAADPELLRQEHAVFERAAAKGITLVAGSGDFGATNLLGDGSLATSPAAATPASDPDVTAVGGTQLTIDPASGAWVSETAWNDALGPKPGASGGGFSAVYKRPGYQAPFIDENQARGLPDVSYSASAFGATMIVLHGHFGAVFGTSGGVPQWAGIDALSRQMAGHRQSQLNIRLYHLAKSAAYRDAFHDITTGNNDFAGVKGFDAGPGWDAVTGLGTPDVAKLVPLLS